MTDLSGKVAVITGASKGIGRATALRLARDGVRTVLAATDAGALGRLEKEIEALGPPAMGRPCDVTRHNDCQNLAQAAHERFGRIDILVNNAGIGYSGTVVDSDPDEVEWMIRVNLLGVYHMSRAVLPGMIHQKRGDIVNIGSVAGLKYSPKFAMYSATKFAVRAFSEGLRNEVQPHNIRVTTVHPGMTDTHFFDSFSQGGMPLPADRGDILRPEDIADAVHFVLTRPSNTALNELTLRPAWQER
jgi:NADP-dependent 3-hydroxy acid dehydrogenase YdfG